MTCRRYHFLDNEFASFVEIAHEYGLTVDICLVVNAAAAVIHNCCYDTNSGYVLKVLLDTNCSAMIMTE